MRVTRQPGMTANPTQRRRFDVVGLALLFVVGACGPSAQTQSAAGSVRAEKQPGRSPQEGYRGCECRPASAMRHPDGGRRALRLPLLPSFGALVHHQTHDFIQYQLDVNPNDGRSAMKRSLS